MSNDAQNLNEETFRPDYGTDNHGIQYSCGHINPLQRALKNNAFPRLQNIKNNLENLQNSIQTIIQDADYIKDELMDFAKNRCEEIRSINSELRDAIENGCDCSSDGDCDNCYDLRSEKSDLIEERDELENNTDELKNQKEKLENEVEELEKNLQSLEQEKKTLEKDFQEIKEKYHYLKWIFDTIQENKKP